MLKKKKCLLILLLIFISFVLIYAEDDISANTAETEGDISVKPAMVIIPLFSEDVPAYVPKVTDKLIRSKIQKIDTYNILPEEDLTKFLKENDITVSRERILEELEKYSGSLKVDQILYGNIRFEDDEYVLDTKIFDVKNKNIILTDTEAASDIRHLESAADALTRKVVKKLFSPEIVDKAEKVLDAETDAKKEAQVKDSLADFADLAEKDPEKALELVNEPARKAIEATVKEKVKEEVVQEEIQNLFEKEKEEKAYALKRKRQFWTIFTFESLNQIGNLFSILALTERENSLFSWNKYMNDDFAYNPYDSYKRSVNDYEGFTAINYLFSGLGNITIGVGINYLLDDSLAFSKTGKYLFSISYGMNTLGNAVATLSSQLSFISMHKYLEYSYTDTDFTSKYNAYRDSLLWPAAARYTAYGLWGLGYAGIITSYFLPGERKPMIVSRKARRLMSWGSALTGFGNISSNLAMKYRGEVEELWINENASGAVIGDTSYGSKEITAEIFTYTSYGLILGGSVLTIMGLLMPGEEITANKPEEKNITFNIIPAENGASVLVNLRME